MAAVCQSLFKTHTQNAIPVLTNVQHIQVVLCKRITADSSPPQLQMACAQPSSKHLAAQVLECAPHEHSTWPHMACKDTSTTATTKGTHTPQHREHKHNENRGMQYSYSAKMHAIKLKRCLPCGVPIARLHTADCTFLGAATPSCRCRCTQYTHTPTQPPTKIHASGPDTNPATHPLTHPPTYMHQATPHRSDSALGTLVRRQRLLRQQAAPAG